MVFERKYSWRSGHGTVSAQIAGETLEMIERRDGQISKEAFLEESRPENSPTHNCFEWDDFVAAEKYRLNQSAAVIRDVVVSVEMGEGRSEKVSAFVNIVETPTAQTGAYRSLDVAISQEDTRGVMLQNALKEMESFQKKYSVLSELAAVFDVMESVKGGAA